MFGFPQFESGQGSQVAKPEELWPGWSLVSTSCGAEVELFVYVVVLVGARSMFGKFVRSCGDRKTHNDVSEEGQCGVRVGECE